MSSEKRLHPAAFLVHALGGLRDVLVPAIVALALQARSLGSGTLIALFAALASCAIGWARWSSTRYWVSGSALHFRSGVFSPDEQLIPIARIAAIDEVVGPIQRLFGVVALNVQTAGGEAGGEIQLTALSHADAAALRAQLGFVETGPEAPAPEWRLSARGLVAAALTGPQVGILAPIAGGAAALGQQVFSEDTATEVAHRLPDTVHGWILLVAALAAVAFALSLLGAVVAFSGFVVRREPRRLRIRRGLLQRRATSVGIERVHAVRIVEGALREPLGLCSVRLEVAGYRGERAAARTLVPLCRHSEVAGILARLVPELPVPSGPPERPPARARRRYVTRPVVAGAFAGALAAIVAVEAGVPPEAWLAPAVGAAAGTMLGLARFASAGWWERGSIVAVRRRGVLARTTIIAAIPRLQHRELSCSWPARRARLATVGFAVASGTHAAIAHLDRGVARKLFASLGPSRPASAAPGG